MTVSPAPFRLIARLQIISEGYYDALDADDRAKLLRDLEIVRAESASSPR
jgi:hypothetical protein